MGGVEGVGIASQHSGAHREYEDVVCEDETFDAGDDVHGGNPGPHQEGHEHHRERASLWDPAATSVWFPNAACQAVIHHEALDVTAIRGQYRFWHPCRLCEGIEELPAYLIKK